MKTFSPPDYHKFLSYLAIAGLGPDRLPKRYGFSAEVWIENVFISMLAYNCRKSLEHSVVPQAHQ